MTAKPADVFRVDELADVFRVDGSLLRHRQAPSLAGMHRAQDFCFIRQRTPDSRASWSSWSKRNVVVIFGPAVSIKEPKRTVFSLTWRDAFELLGDVNNIHANGDDLLLSAVVPFVKDNFPEVMSPRSTAARR
jgi:hypothetical protein